MADRFDVFLSHNSKDKDLVRELADQLEQYGVSVWLDERELVPGRPWQEALEEVLNTARSAAVLVGREGIGPWQQPEMRGALSEFVQRGLPVIPVLLPKAPSRVDLPLFLRSFTWVDCRGGFTEDALDQLVWGITGSRPIRGKVATQTQEGAAYRPSTVRYKLEDVFTTIGLPRYTYVEPEIYRRFSHEVRIQGKHLVLEGPSGAGKTCLVFRVLEELGLGSEYTYVSARESGAREIRSLLTTEYKGPRIAVVDDVHMLDPEVRGELANHLKFISDTVFSKVVTRKFILIGIPTAAAGILHDAIDLGPRLRTFKLGRATPRQLEQLIKEGEERLSIRFRDPDVITAEANGSFYLCQYICHEICFAENILEVQAEVVVVRYQIEEIRSRLMEELRQRFDQHVILFCKGRKWKLESASGFMALLASLARLGKSVIYLNELLVDAGPYSSGISEAAEALASSVNGDGLSGLSKLVHYDKSIEAFSVEDPAFRYYLTHFDLRDLFGALGIRDPDFESHYSVMRSEREVEVSGQPSSTRDIVFVSYSHADAEWMDRLRQHLSPLVRQGVLSMWSDTQIRAGTEWRQEINRALESARVAVLLVSADYLASEFIANIELPALLDRSVREGLRIIWAPVSYCLWEQTPIARYQAALDPRYPLGSLGNAEQERALVTLSKTIKDALDSGAKTPNPRFHRTAGSAVRAVKR